MWIHQHPNWPNFTWNMEALASKLAEIRYRQGLLLGRMQNVGFEFTSEASLHILTQDVVKSSAIEGESLNILEVRSSIARRLGIDIAGTSPANRHVDGIVEMMLDATQNFSEPLTKNRLYNWHAALFPTGRSGMHQITVGAWRGLDSGPMQIVSGPIGKEKVYFEAPCANAIDKEMESFLEWFCGEQHLDAILKAGIAHLWFVTIHPFEDGNGRIGRAISDLSLARADGSKERFYSLSAQIESERKEYYNQLEIQQRGTNDITPWLIWFLNCLGRAITNAEISLENVLFKAWLWNKISEHSINNRQRSVINRMLDDGFEGFMNTSKYARLAKCSKDTALRDIQDLKDKRILVQNPGGGRSTSYRLTERSE